MEIKAFYKLFHRDVRYVLLRKFWSHAAFLFSIAISTAFPQLKVLAVDCDQESIRQADVNIKVQAILFIFKGTAHERDFKNVDKNLHN